MTVERLALPADGWSDWLAGRVDGLLQTTRDTLATLKDGTARSASDVLGLWNDADIALRDADAVPGLPRGGPPGAALRQPPEGRAQEIGRPRTDRGLDRVLYDVVADTDPAGLDAQAQRVREHVLRDFRRSGVDQSEEVRARLREISERLTVLDQDFARVIREDVRSIRILPEQLDGLPQDFVEAHPPAEDGLLTITTDYPDYVPFRTFARDRAARRSITIKFLERGWPDNDAVLHEMLALRDEKARILGYRSWPDYDADVKMIGTAGAIGEFVERLADAAESAGRRDRERSSPARPPTRRTPTSSTAPTPATTASWCGANSS